MSTVETNKRLLLLLLLLNKFNNNIILNLTPSPYTKLCAAAFLVSAQMLLLEENIAFFIPESLKNPRVFLMLL